MLTLHLMMPLVNVSCCFGERTRTSYTEGCLYGGLSVSLSFYISCETGSTSPRYQMVFPNFCLEIITPSTLWDLEGSNNVDPLVSGFGPIYLTVKYICLVVLLPVLIFSKPTRVRSGILVQNMSVAL